MEIEWPPTPLVENAYLREFLYPRSSLFLSSTIGKSLCRLPAHCERDKVFAKENNFLWPSTVQVFLTLRLSTTTGFSYSPASFQGILVIVHWSLQLLSPKCTLLCVKERVLCIIEILFILNSCEKKPIFCVSTSERRILIRAFEGYLWALSISAEFLGFLSGSFLLFIGA